MAEKIDADGTVAAAYNVYNQGTFIEGAAALWKITGDVKYLTDAQKTIEYVMVNKVDSRGIMSAWKTDGTWQSEFARGMAALIKNDSTLWKYLGYYTTNRVRITYYRWMRRNADAAWTTRDMTNNITGCKWTETTPAQPSPGKTWECDACVSAVVMTNVVPEALPGSGGDVYVALDDHSEEYASAYGGAAEEPAVVLDADGIMRVSSPINIVCVGNSITEGYGNSSSYMAWPAQMGRQLGGGYSVLNCGVSGTTMGRDTDASYWKTSRYAAAKAANPQVLIIALGTNDADPWRWDQWGGSFKADYLAMVNEFRANGRNPIIFCTLAPPIFPVSSSRQNSYIETKLMPLVREIAGEINAYLIDFHSTLKDKPELFPDNVHPSDDGASVLAGLAVKRLREVQTLQGFITVSEGTVVDSTTAVVSPGATVTLVPVSGKAGSWLWKGPGGLSSTDRVVVLAGVQTGGTYTAEFTDSAGYRSLINFLVSVKGQSAGAIMPYVQMTNSSWQQATELTVRPGYTVDFGPQISGNPEGTWSWKGPDQFMAQTRTVSVSSMNNLRAGSYGVTFTDTLGRQSTCVYNIKVEGDLYCQDLVPYIKYGNTWQQVSSMSLSAGESVVFGPQPSDGEWSWTGPNNYSYNGREARVNNFSAAMAGTYIGTRTTDAGCFEQLVIKLALK